MSIRPLSDYDLLPIYVRVADDLRSKLGTQGFDFGSYLPGEHDIASQYNLSRGTIRRALGILETEGLLSRQPGRGTLILPPSVQAHLARPKVAVVWTMVRWIGMDMFTSLEEHLSEANCDILFNSSKHDHQKESDILTGLLEAEIDAVVLYCTGHPGNFPLIHQIQNRGKPVILLDRFVEDHCDSFCWVTSDNEQGAYEITRHLIELGHQRIGMIMRTPEHERISTLIEREQGYAKAMNEAGFENLLLKKCRDDLDEELTGASFGRDVLAFINAYRPTAIFFHNDASAYRMHPVLGQNGIRVPQDISIVGFDGMDLYPELLNFDLTTVAQDFFRMGQEVGKLVLSLVRNPGHPVKHIRLPIKLHVGNTTAPPPIDSGP